MDEAKPVTRGFLNCLFEASAGAPDHIQNVVRQAIASRNTIDLMRWCEIVDKQLVTLTSETLVKAAALKIDSDMRAKCVGDDSLLNLLRHVAVTGIIMGAHLAKEKKL